MMDQVNFEATRPVSADPAVDPAVALAEALGQLPDAPLKAPAKIPLPKGRLEPKVSVESLAQEVGLKLGDQNELTIRRIKRGRAIHSFAPMARRSVTSAPSSA
jgi:DNA topoisomerase-1